MQRNAKVAQVLPAFKLAAFYCLIYYFKDFSSFFLSLVLKEVVVFDLTVGFLDVIPGVLFLLEVVFLPLLDEVVVFEAVAVLDVAGFDAVVLEVVAP